MKKLLFCLTNLEKSYETKVLAIKKLDIFAGECLCITGKNGSGKSTLLKIIAGLVSADVGNISYKNQTFPAQKRHLLAKHSTYLSSTAYLFDCNVENNIGYPLFIKKISNYQDKVAQIIKWGNLTKLKKYHPNELSSGQIQMVALARAKIINPKIWLLDEPTENLDNAAKQLFFQLIHQLLLEKRSVIIATHSAEITKNIPSQELQLIN